MYQDRYKKTNVNFLGLGMEDVKFTYKMSKALQAKEALLDFRLVWFGINLNTQITQLSLERYITHLEKFMAGGIVSNNTEYWKPKSAQDQSEFLSEIVKRGLKK